MCGLINVQMREQVCEIQGYPYICTFIYGHAIFCNAVNRL